ncbi:phosphatase PAP2 family protein [Agrobacterium sp. CNPSo 3708]|uniref:phosphatase PAP2 family protein n=1 Tax=unclassified Agrobacterium TaxID=2632611 RepID=UPI0023634FE7|nr:phosphatase PAP2 family protein [Agrobacterium sp. CNPSo 3708]MDD1498483.1 phosphatase PAP2 family protein [Agrobacterium sp. CNPSo 3708]
MDHDILHMRLTIWLTIATLCAVIVFAAFPFLDLRISSLFFNGQAGDWMGRSPDFMFWRDVLRHGGEAFAVVTFLIFLGNILIGTTQQTGWRVWAFIWGNTLACAGLLVNGILKTWLGRARPDGVIEFGGVQTFTPAFQLSNQCFKNCSFSSGEAALIASVVLPVCVLLWPQLSRSGKVVCTVIAAFLVIATAAMRMAAGRHFLSDTTMSILFAALTSLILYRVLAIGQHRQVFTVRSVVADVSVIILDAQNRGLRLLTTVLRNTVRAAIYMQTYAAREWTRFSQHFSSMGAK